MYFNKFSQGLYDLKGDGNDKLLIDEWRDSLHYGIKHRFKGTNIILQGGIDDVWFDKKARQILHR